MGGKAENQAAADGSAKNLSATLDRLGKYFEDEAPVEQKKSLRSPPANDSQLDFFVPSLHDIPVKDGIGIMDVAVFRLSKSQPRNGEGLRYELSDAVIEVSSGGYGMASIYDYDIVIMVISQLANAVKKYRLGQGEKPGKEYRIHASDIFKFCRMQNGGNQYRTLDAALKRLDNTVIEISDGHLTFRPQINFVAVIKVIEIENARFGRIGDKLHHRHGTIIGRLGGADGGKQHAA